MHTPAISKSIGLSRSWLLTSHGVCFGQVCPYDCYVFSLSYTPVRAAGVFPGPVELKPSPSTFIYLSVEHLIASGKRLRVVQVLYLKACVCDLQDARVHSARFQPEAKSMSIRSLNSRGSRQRRMTTAALPAQLTARVSNPVLRQALQVSRDVQLAGISCSFSNSRDRRSNFSLDQWQRVRKYSTPKFFVG